MIGKNSFGSCDGKMINVAVRAILEEYKKYPSHKDLGMLGITPVKNNTM